MKKLLVIDGNSILNRAFYGIMSSKSLMSADGIYTNAIYGFLTILFKNIEEIKPEYLVIAFDVKAPTKRHLQYAEYKGTRKKMPEELAMQMPILKEILECMNICTLEKAGYEADDILGTLAKFGENNNLEVNLLSGDRDTFQLASDTVFIRIPRTKLNKTETEIFDKNKIIETYEITPIQLIETKALMGDSSDNIPGVPGVGEKTAFDLIKKYNNIENLYTKIENNDIELKEKLREKLVQNKDLAFLSKELGTIDLNADITKDLEKFKVEPWNNEKVLEIFKRLRFSRFIERFSLENKEENEKEENIKIEIPNEEEVNNLIKLIEDEKKLFYYIEKEELKENILPLNKKIVAISIYLPKSNKLYFIQNDILKFKDIFQNKDIQKFGYKQKEDYLLLKQIGIIVNNFTFDVEIAGYVLNSSNSNYSLETLSKEYLDLEINLNNSKKETGQINLFEIDENVLNVNVAVYAMYIYKLYNIMFEKLKEFKEYELFKNIEMPLIEVLANMQYEGVFIDKEELLNYGVVLQNKIDELIKEIYNLTEIEFNVNSPKQLGEVLFEKLKLPIIKKNKSGYSTDVDVLEKLKETHPAVEKILEYRQLSKLKSTFVDGLVAVINKNTNKIHSSFHQTVTTTGRISSTEPNLQNIPTRVDIGKKIRAVFKPKKDFVFIDADYSQIELRILAHVSNDINMIEAFNNDEDIHKQAAAKVFNLNLEDVTKEDRSKAKAVNFGIVYGISDFGLAEQLKINKKLAKQYIEQYLEKYSGIKNFMDNIIIDAKEKGYVETLFNRRRYVPEINSSNYMIRQFGNRIAMNMPIQGTAADIMKIAMIDIYNKLKENNLKSKLILQVHDEVLVETYIEEKDIVKKIIKESMENVIKLKVPLKSELEEGTNWSEAK